VKRVFADTSGIYAALYAGDPFHQTARDLWIQAEQENWKIQSTNYVVVETTALVQVRLGWEFVQELQDIYWPLCEITFVDPELHALGSARHRQAARRGLSLVDCCSFEFMARHHLREAIAFDRHFQEADFTLPD